MPTALVRLLDLGMEPFDGVVCLECNFSSRVLPGEAHGLARTSCSASSIETHASFGDLGPELVGDLTPLRPFQQLLGVDPSGKARGGDEGGIVDVRPTLVGRHGPAGCAATVHMTAVTLARWRRGSRVAAAFRPLRGRRRSTRTSRRGSPCRRQLEIQELLQCQKVSANVAARDTIAIVPETSRRPVGFRTNDGHSHGGRRPRRCGYRSGAPLRHKSRGPGHVADFEPVALAAARSRKPLTLSVDQFARHSLKETWLLETARDIPIGLNQMSRPSGIDIATVIVGLLDATARHGCASRPSADGMTRKPGK